jgi:hypothetical protein
MHAVASASRQPDRRGLAFAAALLLLLAGMWQLGGGLAIRAKAILAQILVRDAWERTLKGERQAKPLALGRHSAGARLSAPAQRIDPLRLAGANGRTIAFGPGHVFGNGAAGRRRQQRDRRPPRHTHLAFLRDTSRERAACSGRTAHGAATEWRPPRCSTPRIWVSRARMDRRASRSSPATRSDATPGRTAAVRGVCGRDLAVNWR